MSSFGQKKWETYLLSTRGLRYISMEQPTSAFAEFKRDPTVKGLIDLAQGDNKIVGDLIVKKLSEHLKVEERDTQYFLFEGSASFRTAIAKFLELYMKPADPINLENIIVTNGAGAMLHSLGSVLSDPGDGILIPAPYYYGFDADFTLQAETVCYPVDLLSQSGADCCNPFELTVAKLETALAKAKQENVRIRALVLCNPNNPLACVYSKELVTQCLKFAQRHSLHVISDEIYMLSVVGDCSWSSASSIKEVIDPKLLHIVWGFSKDFGLSGYRVGVLFSRNAGVVEAMKALSYYNAVPPIIQNALECLISDQDWVDTIYLPTFKKRLSNCMAIATEECRRLNIRITTPTAGLFVWANFSHYIEPLTFENEKALTNLLVDYGVLLSPGSIFACSQPGWFRIVVANDPAILETGFERIKSALAAFPKARNVSKEQTAAQVSGLPTTLEELVSELKTQIEDSDWLKENTAEKWMDENPQLAQEFMEERKS